MSFKGRVRQNGLLVSNHKGMCVRSTCRSMHAVFFLFRNHVIRAKLADRESLWGPFSAIASARWTGTAVILKINTNDRTRSTLAVHEQ